MRVPLAFAVALAACLPGSASAFAGADAGSVEDARDGLAAYLEANRPASPTTSTNIEGCPAIGLDRLEASLAENGFDDPLGGWATEIEWDEYADFDPNLMGIACGGDADGDPHDSDFGLAAGVVAVDVGSADRVLELYDYMGYGTLEIEDADVPGGELSSTCVNDDGLGVCLSFWSRDGLVIGFSVWSSEREIAEGTSSAVLADILPDVLVALGEAGDEPAVEGTGPPAPSSPAATTSSGLDVAGARAGLARFLGDATDTGPNEPLPECTLVDRATATDALQTAGIDAPLERWDQEVGPLDGSAARAITCSGVYVGVEDDSTFPEVTATMLVADLGDEAAVRAFLADAFPEADGESDLPTPRIGGGTIGTCAEVDRTIRCTELWHADGLVVVIDIADRLYVDRPTASAVLNELVPVVVESLAGGAIDVADPLAAITNEEVDAASAGLVRFVTAAPPGEIDCPTIDAAAFEGALGEADVDLPVADWIGRALADGEERGVNCHTPNDATAMATVNAVDFGDAEAAADYVASLGLPDGGSADDLEPGDLTVGSCTSAEDASGDVDYCMEWWYQGSLVIGVILYGPSSAIGPNDAAEVLVAVMPEVLTNLAAA